MNNNLYKITKRSPYEFEIALSSASHPVFLAHFEGNPVLPGFVLIDICGEALGVDICEISRAKFISFARPDETLSLTIKERGGAYAAEFVRAAQKICTVNFKGVRVE